MNERAQAEEVEHLRRQVRNLKAEMELLLERNDEILLLDVISEKLTLETSAQAVIDTIVERIASLNDLTYCAFLSVSDELGTVQGDWGPKLRTSLSGQPFLLASEIGSGLNRGSVSCP